MTTKRIKQEPESQEARRIGSVTRQKKNKSNTKAERRKDSGREAKTHIVTKKHANTKSIERPGEPQRQKETIAMTRRQSNNNFFFGFWTFLSNALGSRMKAEKQTRNAEFN